MNGLEKPAVHLLGRFAILLPLLESSLIIIRRSLREYSRGRPDELELMVLTCCC